MGIMMGLFMLMQSNGQEIQQILPRLGSSSEL